MNQVGKYSFTNAKVRAMLSQIISAEETSRFASAKDLHELAEMLKGTTYKESVPRLSGESPDFFEFEKNVMRENLRALWKIHRALPGEPEKDFVLLLLQRFELEQLKTILRIWHKRAPVNPADYLIGERIVFNIDYAAILNAQNIDEIIVLLDDFPYRKALIQTKDKFKAKDSGFYLEAGLDRDYYNRLVEATDRFSAMDRSVARRVLGVEIDIENINWLIRLRKYYSLGMADMMEWFIAGGSRVDRDSIRSFYSSDGLPKVVESVSLGPYAKLKEMFQENANLMEGFLYEVLLTEVRKCLAGFPFTIGTILAYAVLKRKETRNIVSLAYAKAYGWDKDAILPMMNIC
jgi:V/A-type H+/Na+-transporting ATPase subunit C